MKVMKKVLAAALMAAMVLSMTACGGAKGGSDTWKIGGIGPLTGGAALYGNAALNGAQIAVDEINAAGGINGFKIEFKAEDDQHDAEKSVNAYNSLKDWGMQALCGTVTTTPCLAVAELSAEDNIFEVTPSASNPDVVSHDNCFQVCFTDPNQGSASAKYIGEKKLASKVAVIYNSSDSYSQGVEETFVKEAANQSFEIVVETAFTDDSKTDFSTQLQQCQDAGAELVFCPFYYEVAAVILTQADQMGYKPIFFGVDGMDGILGVENFDTKLAEGVYLLTPFAADATDERTQKFVKTYQDKYGETPIQFAADGYDVIYVIKAAAEKANLKPSQTNEELCKALSQAMTQLSVDGLTGNGMTWAASGEVSKAPMAVIIKDGVYVSVE